MLILLIRCGWIENMFVLLKCGRKLRVQSVKNENENGIECDCNWICVIYQVYVYVLRDNPPNIGQARSPLIYTNIKTNNAYILLV